MKSANLTAPRREAGGRRRAMAPPHASPSGGRAFPRLFLIIPRRHPRPARQQRLDRRQPAARKAEHGIMLSGEGPGRDHLSLSVDSPASARMKLMIQKRITTVGSLQPRCSK